MKQERMTELCRAAEEAAVEARVAKRAADAALAASRSAGEHAVQLENALEEFRPLTHLELEELFGDL